MPPIATNVFFIPSLDDFGVSMFPFRMDLNPEDISKAAGKVPSPQDMLKRKIFEAKKDNLRV